MKQRLMQEQQQQQEKEKEEEKYNMKKKCLVCSEGGNERAVEILPDKSILYMSAHNDGRVCKWSEGSMSTAIRAKRKHGASPVGICPKCQKEGHIHWFLPHQDELLNIRYYVLHEVIPGTWGKEKMKRRRRCYINKQEHRTTLLKQLGRYIADPPKKSKRKYVTKK